MIVFHLPGQKGVQCADLGHCHSLMREAAWIDLIAPTEQEEIIVDMAFSLDLPTHREMQDIELSRRLYKEDGALFMTANILTNADDGQPQSSAITFIFAENRLLTLRYADPSPFEIFRRERESDLARYDTAERIIAGLIDAIIDRIADVLESTGASLDTISHEIFSPSVAAAQAAGQEAKPRNLEEVLRRLGRCSDLLSRCRESLAGLGRLLSFFVQGHREMAGDFAEHLRVLSRDLQPLADHASFLSQKVNFLLDATLGLINIEQNAIIKIFTVAAVLFLPPTVVGTIYGMNFENMPETHWHLGYPFALVLMVFSAVAPYWYFKRRGWF